MVSVNLTNQFTSEIHKHLKLPNSNSNSRDNNQTTPNLEKSSEVAKNRSKDDTTATRGDSNRSRSLVAVPSTTDRNGPAEKSRNGPAEKIRNGPAEKEGAGGADLDSSKRLSGQGMPRQTQYRTPRARKNFGIRAVSTPQVS